MTDDFISLCSGVSPVEGETVDLLKLQPDQPAEQPAIEPTEPAVAAVTAVVAEKKVERRKPFYPSCKRVLTRAPFATPCPPPSAVALSIQELMDHASEETTTPPVTPRSADTTAQAAEVARLRDLLRAVEEEKRTLQGYVSDLQSKLAARPERRVGALRHTDTQTAADGVKCPTCSITVEPTILLQSFGENFTYDAKTRKFLQKSSGFVYDPYTRLFFCQENGILYFWDSTNNIYHYHSKPEREEEEVEEAQEEEEEEEGELNEEEPENGDENGLAEAAQSAMKKSGIEFVDALNMYYNVNTGLHYCQSSGLYFDRKMSVFYKLTDSKYLFHSIAKPDETQSAIAKTSIRAVVTETSCHKVTKGSLYIFTCMGGSVGREGNHVAVFCEIRVSKRHATITYSSNKFFIADEGTVNGTFLNGQRLSKQKVVSDRFELSHLDELRIGSTTLQLHIHQNNDTCQWCEPGVLSTAGNNSSTATGGDAVQTATISEPPALYKQRNIQNNKLKRKYKLLGK